MPHAKGLHPGTTWRRCDLQCHSPRDRGWIGTISLPGGTPEYEHARANWAEDFVRAAATRGVTAIAVTDHHDVCMARYVQAAAKRLDSGVLVYAGIEITCKDNAQCIAVFDPTCSEDVQRTLIAKLGGVITSPANSPKTCPILPATVSVEELFEAVADEPLLRDVCILLPHFSDDDADVHKSLNVKGYHPRFAGLNCYGVYVEKPFLSLSQDTVDKIRGKVDDWGTRRRALIATGDTRSNTWDRLGIHECYIKLGEESLEGMRQAFLADEARVTFTKPIEPTEHIRELRVKSSLTGGDPIVIVLNPGLTAFVGGRGSGKTAMLEYLRFGLGRTEIDIGERDEPLRGREAKLIEDTLGDGCVELVIEREGVTETWRRMLAHRETITMTDSDGLEHALTLEEARRRFRARAFYQKGLSTTMNDPATAADQITGIAAAEALDRRREIDQQIQNTKRAVTTALQQLAAHWQVQLERKQAKERVADLKTRIDAIADLLKKEGVSPEAFATIEAAPVYTRAKAYLTEVKRVITADTGRIKTLSDGLLPVEIARYEGVGTFDELTAFNTELSNLKQEAYVKLEEVADILASLDLLHGTTNSAFGAEAAEFEVKYNEAVQQQAKHSALLNENTRLVGELRAAEETEARAAARELDTVVAIRAFADVSNDLKNLLTTRRTILEEAANQVAGKSSHMLKARLKRDPVPIEYIDSLRDLMEGSHIHDMMERCTTWITDALKDDADSWNTICNGVLEAYQAKIAAGSPPEPGEELAGNIHDVIFDGTGLTPQQNRRIYRNMDDTTVSAIVSAVPKDFIVMTYIDDVGREYPFQLASPGQQASALLELLLNQHAGTLIIDQPEDDLDNRIIMNIVDLIRTSKSRRQLIFATHNSNIVVNGDADKIVVLKSGQPVLPPNPNAPKIQIDEDGAIETPAIRTLITRVMEGGREAFDLRGRKYGFDSGSYRQLTT
jgi:ABC-type dipeptide/oligopeptide/nickel transport system ATPase subunit